MSKTLIKAVLRAMNRKILFVIDDLNVGGAEKITTDLANHLATCGHSITLAVLNNLQQFQNVSNLVELIDLKINSKFSKSKLWSRKELNTDEIVKVDQFINSQKFDLIVLGHLNGHYLTKYIIQKDCVWHWIHGEMIELRPAKNNLKKLKEKIRFIRHKRSFTKLFKNKNLITVNRDLADRYKTIIPSSKFKIIANGINLPIISKEPNLKLWDTIFVGRLVSIKQVDHAIKAFIQSDLSGKMAIVGDGPLKENLVHLVKSLGYDNKIEFLGWIDNPLQLMQQSKSLIMSSFYEGCPITIIEAISLNIPVVSYDSSSGVSECFTDHFKPMCLVEKQNIVDLAEKLQNAVLHPFCYDQESIERISINHMAKKFLSLIESNTDKAQNF